MINTSIDALRRGNMLPEIGGIPDDVWETTDNNHDADKILLYNDLITLNKTTSAGLPYRF